MIKKDYLYSVEEVAKILRVNKNTAYALIKKGHLKAFKFEKIKVPGPELLKFLKECTGKDFTDMDNVRELKF